MLDIAEAFIAYELNTVKTVFTELFCDRTDVFYTEIVGADKQLHFPPRKISV